MKNKIILPVAIMIIVFFIKTLMAQDQSSTSLQQNNLLSTPPISVTIGGDFVTTGSFPAYVGERVDEFITQVFDQFRQNALGSINDPQVMAEINKRLSQYSLRGIKLKRADGTELDIDLLKFRITGDFSDNPYLKNDDVIIFPPYNIETNFFTISGAVNKPGKFLFIPGDKLSDAIMLAQGIDKAYEHVDTAEISRLNYNGTKQTTLEINIHSNSDYALQRGDRIIIKAKETDRKAYSVYVVGEVNSPGEIPITKDSTTLKEVMNIAGGFKSDASIKDTRLFTGNSVSMLLEKQYGIQIKNNSDLLSLNLPQMLINVEKLTLSRMSNLTVDDTTYFYLENELRILNESGSIDFTKLNDKNSNVSKYIVRNGDVIIVPPKKDAVYVFGQVVNPGYVHYVEGKDFRYYIQQAGGYGEFAEGEGNVMVIKGDTKNWISPTEKNVNIEDGDFIYVPKSIQRPFTYYLGITGSVLGIVGSLATLILLLIKL